MEQHIPTPVPSSIEHPEPSPMSPSSPDKGPLECNPPEPDCSGLVGHTALKNTELPQDFATPIRVEKKNLNRSAHLHWSLSTPIKPSVKEFPSKKGPDIEVLVENPQEYYK